MGTGIGINCKRCGHQLNYDDGFDNNTKLCDECHSIVKFESGDYPKVLSDFTIDEIISELYNRSYDIDSYDIAKLAGLYNEWADCINK